MQWLIIWLMTSETAWQIRLWHGRRMSLSFLCCYWNLNVTLVIWICCSSIYFTCNMCVILSLSIVRHTGHFSVPLWLIFIRYAKLHALYLQVPIARSIEGATGCNERVIFDHILGWPMQLVMRHPSQLSATLKWR